MPIGLSVNRLINVSVNLTPQAAQFANFNSLLVMGNSDVINVNERIRSYNSLAEVAADFGVDAPEYDAATLFFGQIPQPTQLYIGRWADAATSGLLNGGVLTTAQQAIANWNAVSSGGVDFTIDGSAVNLSGLDFTAETNLNGVAEVIDAALSPYASCAWDGELFTVTSASTGPGARATGTVTLDTNVSPGVRASGTVTLTTNPADLDTLTVNGTAITFVASGATGNQVNIGLTATATATALQAFLAASADTNIAACTYLTIGTVTTVTARNVGTAGNSITLAKSSTHITLSGANLTGGAAANTLTVNGTAITFVDVTPTGNQVRVGATNLDTAANLQTFLLASVDTNLLDCSYTTEDNILTVTAVDTGTAGNSITLAKSSTHITLSGATLSGGAVASTVAYATAGSGTDISTMLKMTSTLASPPVDGIAAETPLEATVIMDNLQTSWYGLMFASPDMTEDDHVEVAGYIQAAQPAHVYGVSTTNTNVLSSTVTTDIASVLQDLGYTRTFVQYAEAPYVTASFFGRAFTVNFAANNSTITLMYKQEPGVVPLTLTASQANTLIAKRCNFFVNYNNNTAILQDGVMAGPAYFDEIHGTDWLSNQAQTNVYNLLYTTPTKVPQTDAGNHLIVTAVQAACAAGVNNGLIAPGQWNSGGFGTLQQGDFLAKGYYVYAQPISTQAQADREARRSVPIQVAVKLAGAIQTVDVIINVNR